jgi:hypothetical protein
LTTTVHGVLTTTSCARAKPVTGRRQQPPRTARGSGGSLRHVRSPVAGHVPLARRIPTDLAVGSGGAQSVIVTEAVRMVRRTGHQRARVRPVPAPVAAVRRVSCVVSELSARELGRRFAGPGSQRGASVSVLIAGQRLPSTGDAMRDVAPVRMLLSGLCTTIRTGVERDTPTGHWPVPRSRIGSAALCGPRRRSFRPESQRGRDVRPTTYTATPPMPWPAPSGGRRETRPTPSGVHRIHPVGRINHTIVVTDEGLAVDEGLVVVESVDRV